MKVTLVGKNSKNIEGLVKKFGFEMVTTNPDVVISFGGDGTLLHAEREYPSVPKLPIRDSQFCNKCPKHDESVLLKELLQNQLTLKTYKKLKTEIGRNSLFALNEFSIRNAHPTHAIRFRVHNNLYIGDGVVVSTPFGSPAYFKSITGQIFSEGFGLAFNNTTEKVDPIFLGEGDKLKFELIRNIAQLTQDNSPDIYNLKPRSNLTFSLSNEVARIYEAQSLRCPNCQIIRS